MLTNMWQRFLATLDAVLEALVYGDKNSILIDHTQPQNTPVLPPNPSLQQSSPQTQDTPHTPLLEAFLNEIKNMEGNVHGFNPGNLRCPPLNVLALRCENNFCVFPNEATGMQALRNVTVTVCNGTSATYNTAAQRFGLANGGELNLYQYFLIRDPASDNNQPNLLAERFGRVLNVDPASFRMKLLLG